MSEMKKTREPIPLKRTAKGGPTYRGVRLPSMEGRSQFTEEQVVQAIEAAILKHPDAFTSTSKS
jgi:hypothetical protein